MGVKDEAEGYSDEVTYQGFLTGRSVNGLSDAKLKFHFDTRPVAPSMIGLIGLNTPACSFLYRIVVSLYCSTTV